MAGQHRSNQGGVAPGLQHKITFGLRHRGTIPIHLCIPQKGQVATSPQSVATFVYTWGGRKEFEVRKDQEFPLATAEGNRTYKLIDVRPDKAVIVNAQNPGAPIEIGFASP